MALKYFKDDPSLESRALQIWQILISKAHNRQTITYEMLADLIGYKGSGVLGPRLGRIWAFCTLHDLPQLGVLVVGKYAGEPALEFEECIDGSFDKAREAVFEYDWYALYPPSESDFAQAWKTVT